VPGDADHALAGEKAMIVAGIGCRRGAEADAIEATIDAALATCGLARARLDALATAPTKGDEPGLREIAERWALRLLLPDQSRLEGVAALAKTDSARSRREKGVPSVAETAALAAAGRSARLLAPRVKTREATCAIAVGDGSIENIPGGGGR
jgi:cobalt-precorrin 5A hydrolase